MSDYARTDSDSADVTWSTSGFSVTTTVFYGRRRVGRRRRLLIRLRLARRPQDEILAIHHER